MGGGHSKFDQNNWFKANGKLTSTAETIDGAAPTSQYCVYWITKRAGRTKYVVNQRDFDVVDGERNLMYSTSAVPGTLLYFDVLGPGLEEYKLRVISDLARRHWTVYRYGTPTFPGQVHDNDATLQLTQEHSTDGIRRFPSGLAPKLYKVCGITVSWSRYAAVAVMFGPPPPPNPNASMISNSSDHHATATREDDETEDGEEVSHGSGSALPHAPTDENSQNEKESTETTVDESVEVSEEVPAREGEEEPQLVTEVPPVEDTMPLTGPTSPWKDESPVKGGDEEASTPVKESAVVVDLPTPTSAATTPTAAAAADAATTPSSPILKPNKSLDMFLEMENSNRGSTSNNRRRVESGDSGSVTSAGSKSTKGSIKSSLSSVLAASSSLRATQQLPSWLFSKAKKASHHSATASSSATSTSYMSHNPMEGVLQMDRPLLQCQEIFTHLIGTHQTMLISKEQVVQMLKDDAAKEREASHKRGENHEDENVEVRLEDAEALFSGQAIPATHHHEQQQQQQVDATAAKEVQEEIVVAETNKEFTAAAEQPPVATGESTEKVSSTATGDSPEDGGATTTNGRATGDSPQEGSATTTTDATTPNEGATDAVAAMDDAALLAEPLPGTEDDEEQPLVGYWIWENSLYTHKMKMHLAKNSDLALHVVLAVIVNQVRYERNAIALTI